MRGTKIGEVEDLLGCACLAGGEGAVPPRPVKVVVVDVGQLVAEADPLLVAEKQSRYIVLQVADDDPAGMEATEGTKEVGKGRKGHEG